MNLSVIVLAGGRGSRMRAHTPKVLQLLAGKPLLHHLLEKIRKLQANVTQTIVVHGYAGEQVKSQCNKFTNVTWVEQKQQLGTGDAVREVLPFLSSDSTHVLILNGDVPLIMPQTLDAFVAGVMRGAIGVLTAIVDNPQGLGRVIRAETGIKKIVEQKDATADQKEIKEINTGIYLVAKNKLNEYVPKIQANNAQKEYYLTDIIEIALSQQDKVFAIQEGCSFEVLGVNTQQELATLEQHHRQQQAALLMQKGAKLYDPSRVDVRGEVVIGKDVVIDVNVVLEGNVHLGDGVVIEPNVIIRNSAIGANSYIKANSVIDDATIDAMCEVGPFARIRPGTCLKERAKVGNFVEIKNTQLGSGSKANHLSYLGDAEIGQKVNIGAGTVTCNYDGVNKSKTIIADNAFIGSNSELIAPVMVGQKAVVGAGTTLVHDAPEKCITRNRKETISYKCEKALEKN